MNHRPKKSLGQNFLNNESIVDKIVAAADVSRTDTILEIGPGMGVLTRKLLEKAGKVVAVEKDDSLIGILGETFNEYHQKGSFLLQNKDILETEPAELGLGTQYKLVANIPYYITGAIIEKFLSTDFQPKSMVLMVQKEVADRIIAKDKKTGNAGKESILSIAVKAYGTPVYITTVKAGNFTPAPSVDSAVIAIYDISRKHFTSKHHEQVFFQVMKAGFAHKRKTLAGNLKNILEPEVVDAGMRAVGLRPTARAEDVGISQWLDLATFVYTGNHESA